jgi:hypothetical protein
LRRNHKEQKNSKNIQRSQPKNSPYVESQPIDWLPLSIKHFCEKQEACNHKKQYNATFSKMSIKVGWRSLPLACSQIEVPNAGVVKKYKECEVAAQTINRGESSRNRGLTGPLRDDECSSQSHDCGDERWDGANGVHKLRPRQDGVVQLGKPSSAQT